MAHGHKLTVLTASRAASAERLALWRRSPKYELSVFISLNVLQDTRGHSSYWFVWTDDNVSY